MKRNNARLLFKSQLTFAHKFIIGYAGLSRNVAEHVPRHLTAVLVGNMSCRNLNQRTLLEWNGLLVKVKCLQKGKLWPWER